MIPDLRERFNRDFTPAKYHRFLSELNLRSGTDVGFRNSETPCFYPKELLDKMARYGAELAEQLVGNPEYLAASERAIPTEYRVPNEASRPLFIQADFGLDAHLEPKLVEIQGFPSLYAYQPVLADTYRDAYDLDPDLHHCFAPDYWTRVGDALLGGHDPQEVVLLEIDPWNQKTLADFLITERKFGIKTVSLMDVQKRGSRLFHAGVPIRRIYNRVIVDELLRKRIEAPFDFRDDLDVEWAGHPNWYFRLSKFSLPFFKHPSVPETWFLEDVPDMPEDLNNYVLKPLFSFAGLGVIVGPTREEVAAVDPAQYILQRKVDFTPVIETPYGATKTEVRIMFLWTEELVPVTTIVRMGRGKMMGVDQNRNMEWVGASAGFFR